MTSDSTPKASESPLVTFALFAYNQEQYVREAVEGAFAQTYSPLEIILSDDCSTDETFEIIKSMTAAYGGPHRIILNRNERNLGLGGSINRCGALASGEWIVVAAGDDISHPERVERILERWKEDREHIFLIYSGYQEMDEAGGLGNKVPFPMAFSGAFIPDLIEQDRFVLGATSAWRKECIKDFPCLNERLLHEDIIFALRASLLGRISFLELDLVKYRIGVGHVRLQVRNNVSFFRNPLGWMRASAGVIESEAKWLARKEIVLSQKLNDLIHFGAESAYVETLRARKADVALKRLVYESDCPFLIPWKERRFGRWRKLLRISLKSCYLRTLKYLLPLPSTKERARM